MIRLKTTMHQFEFSLKQLCKMLLQSIVLPLIYRLNYKRPVDSQLVIFADFHHAEMPFSLQRIYDEISKLDYKIVDYFYDYNTISFFQKVKVLVRFMKLYAQAHYVFICDNFLPVSSCKKKNQTMVVQLWHGCGCLKKFGYSTSGDLPNYYKTNPYKNYDLVTVSSSECVQAFCEAMKYTEKVVKPLGVSRTDYYFEADYWKLCRTEFLENYPDFRGKKIILWAPTFRGNASSPYLVGESEIKRLGELLGQDWRIIVKLHPHLKKNKSCESSRMLAEHLLPIADILITDYSSIAFDYLIFRRPLIFFQPDADLYKDIRGMYIGCDELSPFIADCVDELYDMIIHLNFPPFEAKKLPYMEACDGHATERILKQVGIIK